MMGICTPRSWGYSMYEEDLIYYVNERESIRRKKEAGEPRPWTRDTILQEYRFCNVFREDDVVTKWIADWVRPYHYHPMLPFAIGMARMVNLPSTLQDLCFPTTWDPTQFIEIFASRKLLGKKSWTNAYMITGGYSKGGEPKEVIIARVLTGLYKQLKKDPVMMGDELNTIAAKVCTPGIGTFLQGQIVADLKNTPKWIDVPDWETWCAVGPGSTAGLNYLAGRPPLKALSHEQFNKEVNEIREIIYNATDNHYDLCAQNTQNVLCEFSKYIRTRYHGGKPKQVYKPGNTQ